MDIGKGKLWKGNFTLIVCSLLFVYRRKETYHNFFFFVAGSNISILSLHMESLLCRVYYISFHLIRVGMF